MHSSQADLSGAIAAVSRALESMERRVADLTTQISMVVTQRRDHLDRSVSVMLSDISGQTLVRLRAEASDFAARPEIATAFAKNKKLLGIFKPSTYDQALGVLQVHLKLYLEAKGIAQEEDRIIARLTAGKSILVSQQADALELLRQLEKANRTGSLLHPDVLSGIDLIARRGRVLDERSRKTAPRALARQSQVIDSDDSDSSDIWLWMMTDVPTSFRTLMLSSLSSGGDVGTPLDDSSGTFGGAGASGSFDTATPAASAQGNSSDDLSVSESVQASIATDDRLGAYS